MKRVLICSPPATAIGGIARHSALLQEHLPEAEIFDQWWPLSDRGRSPAVRLAVHGLALTRFVGRLLFRRPHLVHLQVSQPGLRRDNIYARLARLARLPVVSHLHSEFLTAELPELAPIMRTSSRVIALSQEIRHRIVDAYPTASDRVVVVPNPLPPAYLAEVSVTRPTPTHTNVIMVGVISPLKNQLAVARVITDLRAEGTEITLTLAGPPAPELPPAALATLRSADGVIMLGRCDEAGVIGAMDGAAALVLFSLSEGEPLVVLEAMARGLPVISADVGSVKTLLPAAAHNVIVPPEDAKALKAALVSLLRNQGSAIETGKINRACVLRDRSLAQHVALLREAYCD